MADRPLHSLSCTPCVDSVVVSSVVARAVPYSGKFVWVQIFAIWLQSPQQKCLWVLIFAFQCQETTPTNSFACEIPVRGSLSQFYLVNYSILKKHEILHPTKISRYKKNYGIWHLCRSQTCHRKRLIRGSYQEWCGIRASIGCQPILTVIRPHLEYASPVWSP